VKKILRMLISTIDILHQKINIVHTDIKPDNILIKSNIAKHLKIIELFENSNFKEKFAQLTDISTKFSEEYQENLSELIIDSLQGIWDFENKNESESDDTQGSSEVCTSDDLSDNNLVKLNKRNQSVDDFEVYLKETGIYDIENIYDFDNVLNNKLGSTDKKSIIDDIYIENCEIALIDFGTAYYIHNLTEDEVQDRRYRAPEVILNLPYGYPCDIWSVGCVAYELITGFRLFEPENEPLNADIQQLFLMEKMLGKIPEDMIEKSSRKDFLFNKHSNEIRNVSPIVSFPLKERLIKQFLVPESEAEIIADFISQCLIYNPEGRATPKKLLNHNFLN